MISPGARVISTGLTKLAKFTAQCTLSIRLTSFNSSTSFTRVYSLTIVFVRFVLCTMHYAEVVMGRWRLEFLIFEREIYLEYLDTDKMGGQVEKSIWNILTLLKWDTKLAHWSGTKWTDSIFNITTDWKSIMNREKLKSEKRDKYSFPPQIRRLVQNIWNFILFRLNPLFLLFAHIY